MSKEQIREEVRRVASRTVGYNEASDKRSFTVGVDVAFNLSNDLHAKEIERLEAELEASRRDHSQVLDDVKTLVGVISKYTP